MFWAAAGPGAKLELQQLMLFASGTGNGCRQLTAEHIFIATGYY